MGDEPKDPNEAFERQIASTPDKPSISEDDAWGLKQNPVRETPNAAKGLKSGGSSGPG